MLVLSLDTTTRALSCAVARDGVVLLERVGEPTGAHAVRLPTDLIELLAAADLSLAEIDLFAVATGPGSFTGLRIGIATMQGAAFAAAKPLIGISGFDALADVARRGPGASQPADLESRTSRIATWVDAWRGEVYAALYEGGVAVDPPTVALPRDLLPRLAGQATTFVGDAAATFAPLIASVMGPHARIAAPAAPPLAAAVARLAASVARTQLEAGGPLPGPDAIRPLYVRRPGVEITRDGPA